MSYTIRKVGELTGGGASRCTCITYDETITFSDDVAADEWLFLVMSTYTSVNFNGFPLTTLYHPMIDGVSGLSGYCGFASPLEHYSDIIAFADRGNHGPLAPLGVNPLAGIGQPRPLLGGISNGDTATITMVDGRNACGDYDPIGFPGYQAMLVALKTTPALDNFQVFLGAVDGCTDICNGGIPGLINPPLGTQDLASATQEVTAFWGHNPHPGYETTACGPRSSRKKLFLAAFAALTLTPPSYSAGWTEELSTDDGSTLRVGLNVKEISATGDTSDYPITATWGGAENGSAALMQLGEDVPPALHLSHRLGFAV